MTKKPPSSKAKPLTGTRTRRRRPAPAATPFPIVGVGASAGGLEAFTELLTHLPLNTGMAFVLVQHLDPQHESALTEILARATRLPVSEVTQNRRVEPNHVYIIPPNTSLGISRGVLNLTPRKPARTPHHSIDIFFESLAVDQQHSAIGVILSGSANDGTIGLQAIKAEGGVTFAQDETARYDSMPCSAIAEGCVDFVMSPEAIAKELARIAKHPYVIGSMPEAIEARQKVLSAASRAKAKGATAKSAAETAAAAPAGRSGKRGEAPDENADQAFSKILLLLHKHTGVDFTLYKATTIKRRVARRVVLSKHASIIGYADALRGNTKELNALYADLLISVTHFFRDPEVFETLKSVVFAKGLQVRSSEPLRIWTLGCSTGQEAYSLAMAYLECMEQAPQARRLQIFATDLNESVLERARQGFYPKALMQHVSAERLRRFFVEENGGYRVNKRLREMVVFARHNLIVDPPFSRMDLISCRNLLIYLEPTLQQKAIPTFHYALNPGGFMVLGASESVGSFTRLFEAVDKKHKIYARKIAQTPADLLPARRERGIAGVPVRGSHPVTARLASRLPPQGLQPELNAQREADRLAVSQFAPPAVLISDDLQILQFRGATGAYLEPPTGNASFDLLKMAREGLMLPLRALINKAKKEGKPVRKQNIHVQQGRGSVQVHVEVIPLKNLRDRCFLVNFEDADKPSRVPPAATTAAPKGKSERADTRQESRRIAALEAELSETRDYVQSIHEQYETANEELQASNEEVQSANEELQSLNEELETSKEELESANEELTTVNEEMGARNIELSRLNSDLLNLQTSARLAIVMVNRDLTVRRFSDQAAKHFELNASDIGRPIGHVRTSLDVNHVLEPFIAGVIADVQAREREARDRQGHWYSIRVHPYFTADNKIDGAVLVLMDIDALKHTEQAISVGRDYAESIIHTVHDPLLILDSDLHVNRANEAFYKRFRISPARAQGQLIYEVGGGRWDIPALHELLEKILPRDRTCEEFEMTPEFPGMGKRNIIINARLLLDERGKPGEIVLGIRDVTERRHAEAAARMRSAQFETMIEQAPMGICLIDSDLRVREVNPVARAAVGDHAEWKGAAFGKLMRSIWPKAYADELLRRFRHTLETGESYATTDAPQRRLDGGGTEGYQWQIHRIELPEGDLGIACYFQKITAQADPNTKK